MYVLIVGGSPGTGKTSVSRVLSADLGCEYLNATSILERAGGLARDPSGRLTYLATDEGIARAAGIIRRAVEGGSCAVLDTVFPRDWLDVLDDLVPAVILLRCRPDVLMVRLKARGWPWDKIAENVLAEAFGVVAESLIDVDYDVVEIDTTRSTPRDAAEQAFRMLALWRTGIRIDWLSVPEVERLVVELSSRLDRDKYRLGV